MESAGQHDPIPDIPPVVEEQSERRAQAPRPNPDFSATASAVPSDMLNDWLFILSTENSTRIKKSTGLERLFLTQECVNFLFTCCEKLKLPHQVKYASAVLFDEFMLVHVDQLYAYAMSLPEKSVAAKDWSKIEDKIGNQLPLRIVSCIQIASKMVDSYNTVLVKSIVQFLRESFGRCYDPDAILNSEIRIMKTLKYKIRMASPLEYIETLLKLLYMCDNSLDTSSYWNYSMVVLDSVFLHRTGIYDRLMKSAVGAPLDCVTRNRVAYVEADYMLLSTGVICVAACCIDSIGQAELLSKSLQQITRVPSDDMCDLCIAIIQHVMAVTNETEFQRPPPPVPPRTLLAQCG